MTPLFLTLIAAALSQPLESKVNRLGTEKSPYLLQHANNPVDWYPWGEEAIARARREDKPIFLSIGYSTCYWCHVMERESFSNAEIAAAMNEAFVNVKLDREERPDLDEVYMTATQLMTGQGGWPNSLFLTPALEPFFAGTYFPPEDKWGRPGFRSLIEGIGEAWRGRRDDVDAQARELGDAVRHHLGGRFDPGAGVHLLADRVGHRVGLLDHGAAAPLPGLADRGQHPREAGPADPIPRREIGAREERLEVVGQEQRVGPAALMGEELRGGHVDLVEVGTLLAVELDRDEAGVELARDLRVGEALALHHVAPVAGGVAHREEDRLVLAARLLERLLPPRVPVDGVAGVEQQVGARLPGQAVARFTVTGGHQPSVARRRAQGGAATPRTQKVTFSLSA